MNKLKKLINKLTSTNKQKQNSSTKINNINFNRNKFGFPILLNQNKEEVKAQK